MKKILLLLVLISASCISVLSQTYYYKWIETVDKNGVRTKREGGYYVTFTEKLCYFSDEKGYKDEHFSSGVYYYKGIKDNLRIYEATYNIGGNDVLYVSLDYERLNLVNEFDDTHVFVKSDAPKKNADRIKFY